MDGINSENQSDYTEIAAAAETASQNVYVILLIVITAAAIASLASYVKYKQAVEKGFEVNYPAAAIQSFLACLCVPLFLGISNSSLISSISSFIENPSSVNSNALTDYLKLVGLFVIASIYAEGFLDKISTAIIKDIKETNNKLKEQESKLERQQTELDETSNAVIGKDIEGADDGIVDTEHTVTEEQRGILRIFANKPTKYITSGDFSKTANLELLQTKSILKQLQHLNMVGHLTKYDAWYLTSRGARQLEKINGDTDG